MDENKNYSSLDPRVRIMERNRGLQIQTLSNVFLKVANLEEKATDDIKNADHCKEKIDQ